MKLFDSSNYQAQAATVFASVADEVSHLLPDVQIEHIGASAIPGAVSKGDLDICVLVAPQAHAQAVQVLEAASYAIKADTLRTPALCMLLSPRADMDVALQVVAKGSEFEFFLHLRDALRADPALSGAIQPAQNPVCDQRRGALPRRKIPFHHCRSDRPCAVTATSCQAPNF
jgi:GrpB-like predicted nucleotidyltransferase (UPF0157 family)